MSKQIKSSVTQTVSDMTQTLLVAKWSRAFLGYWKTVRPGKQGGECIAMVFLSLNCGRLHLAPELDSCPDSPFLDPKGNTNHYPDPLSCQHTAISSHHIHSPGWSVAPVGLALCNAQLLPRTLLGFWIQACDSTMTNSAALGFDPGPTAWGTLCGPATSHGRGTTQDSEPRINAQLSSSCCNIGHLPSADGY